MMHAATELHRKLADLRAAASAGEADRRGLFDEVQDLIDRLRAQSEPVPADLREIEADLEADILEDFYDNMPV